VNDKFNETQNKLCIQQGAIDMSKALQLAKYYFELSNKSDFVNIEKLSDNNSTFCNRNLEYFIGVTDIMTMQKQHHSLYRKLHWTVNKVKELKDGVILFEFDFDAITQKNEKLMYSGREYLVIREGVIRHIDIRSNI
jgi:hypothetical protein